MAFSVRYSIRAKRGSRGDFSFLSTVICLGLGRRLVLSLFLSISFRVSIIQLTGVVGGFGQGFFL